MIALSFIINKFLFKTKGLDILSLSIFITEVGFPVVISIIINLP